MGWKPWRQSSWRDRRRIAGCPNTERPAAAQTNVTGRSSNPGPREELPSPGHTLHGPKGMKNVLLKNAYSCGRSAEGTGGDGGGPRGRGAPAPAITLAGGAKNVYPLLPGCSDSRKDLSLCNSHLLPGESQTLCPFRNFLVMNLGNSASSRKLGTLVMTDPPMLSNVPPNQVGPCDVARPPWTDSPASVSGCSAPPHPSQVTGR